MEPSHPRRNKTSKSERMTRIVAIDKPSKQLRLGVNSLTFQKPEGHQGLSSVFTPVLAHLNCPRDIIKMYDNAG
jgi:hypothetical protein